MPNLIPAVTTLNLAREYFLRLQKINLNNKVFTPLMTLYLTDHTSAEEIIQAKQSGLVVAAKLYPAGATTNSASGVTAIKNIYVALQAMQDNNMVLCVHGEVVGDNDIFERETIFINTVLTPLLRDFPNLKIVLEHISTEHAVNFVTQAPNNVAATITPHHLILNRNDLLVGGIKPHYYCLPIVKKRQDQLALITAATSGNPKFFLGSDSAPHAKATKQSACGCAGIYSACNALEIYTEVFDKHNALEKLEGFTSRFGAEFYNLPINKEKITLIKKEWTVPTELTFGDEVVVPLLAGETLQWQIAL